MISVEKSYGKRRVNVGFGVLCSGKMYGILDSGGKISTRTREGSTQSENEIGDFQGSRKKGSGRPSGGPREFGPGPAVGGGQEGRIGECENIIRQIFLIFFINFFYKIFIKFFFIKFSVT
jgi:hypothetical protein